MHTLITGMAGFVGSWLAEFLIAQHPETELYGLRRWWEPLDNLSEVAGKYQLIEGDLTDFSSIIGALEKVKPEIIFHLAAQSVPEESLIPILTSKGIAIRSIGELFETYKKKHGVNVVDTGGIETEIVSPKGKQLRALSYWNGMGIWQKVKQISRHRYIGDIVELRQKWGAVRVTPNHCIFDTMGVLVSPLINPELLAVRHINYDPPCKNSLLLAGKGLRIVGDWFRGWGDDSPRIKRFLEGKALEDFLKFAGAYIAEGCVSRQKGGKRGKRMTRVSVSSCDRAWLEELQEALVSFYTGKTWITEHTKQRYRSCFELGADSVVLGTVLSGMMGHRAKGKRLPEAVFQLAPNLQDIFLENLYRGDGSINHWKRFDTKRYTTTSRELACQLALLLTIRRQDYTFSERKSKNPRWSTRYDIRQVRSYNRGADMRAITKVPYDGYVYDLGMEGEQNYALAEGNIVVHNSQVDFSYLAPVQTMETNGIGTVNLLEGVKRVVPEARVVVCSSPEVYGDVQPGVPITEDCPLNPVSPYALSKVTEDRAAFMYAKAYGLKVVISRGFAHEGPRRPEAFALSNFAKQIVLVEQGKQGFVHVGNLKATRTYCDVRDMVRAYYDLALKGSPGEAYNICGAEVMTVGEALRMLMLASVLKKPIPIQEDSSRLRPHDVLWQVGDDSKFRSLTGWKPQIDFHQTLSEMLAWWSKRLAS